MMSWELRLVSVSFFQETSCGHSGDTIAKHIFKRHVYVLHHPSKMVYMTHSRRFRGNFRSLLEGPPFISRFSSLLLSLTNCHVNPVDEVPRQVTSSTILDHKISYTLQLLFRRGMVPPLERTLNMFEKQKRERQSCG